MKKHFATIILIIVFLAGLSLLLYPTVSNYWNQLHASKAIASYSKEVQSLGKDEYRNILEEAKEYNKELAKKNPRFMLDEKQTKEYNSLLNIANTGIMGYIEIESLGVSLPIYHGTDEAVLQIAVGHLDWTSLPTGGENTHCVLSGHRGLPSAKLFTNLDKLKTGDTFVLRVLDEVLTYEVDQILVVEPADTSALKIEEGKDLCTLVTCTPYGVNTHRLLVRGHRVENTVASKLVHVTSDAIQIEPLIVASFIAIPILVVILAVLIIKNLKRRKKF